MIEPDVDLGRLPILTHLPADHAPYITAGVAVICDPDYGRNVSFHRLMVTGGKTLAARLVEGRGTDTAWKKCGDRLPVAICIGSSLAVLAGRVHVAAQRRGRTRHRECHVPYPARPVQDR